MLKAKLWSKYLFDPTAPDDVDAMTETVGWLFEDLLAGNPIDLTGLKSDEINPYHLAVILRGTYTRQDIIPGWREAYFVAKEALSKEDAEDALLGLDKPYVREINYANNNSWFQRLFRL